MNSFNAFYFMDHETPLFIEYHSECNRWGESWWICMNYGSEKTFTLILKLLGNWIHYHIEKIHISETKIIQDTWNHNMINNCRFGLLKLRAKRGKALWAALRTVALLTTSCLYSTVLSNKGRKCPEKLRIIHIINNYYWTSKPYLLFTCGS